MPSIDPREHAAVMAGLRLLQQHLLSEEPTIDLYGIMTDGGSFVALGASEINELCEKLNFGEDDDEDSLPDVLAFPFNMPPN